MAAIIGNSRHDVSADVVGLLWVVSNVGIHRVVYQTIVDASPTREEEHPRRHRSCRLGSLYAEWVGVPRLPIRHIVGE